MPVIANSSDVQPIPQPVKKPVVDPVERSIPITQGKHAIVDAGDFEKLMGYTWCAHKKKNGFWAVTRFSGSSTPVGMHRILMDCPSGFEVDHIDGDGLNNRRRNLRVCSHAENMKNIRLSKTNTSGFKGVSLYRGRRKWAAKISHKDVTKPLGEFEVKEHAAMAYDYAAMAICGEFALTNAMLDLYDKDLAV